MADNIPNATSSARAAVKRDGSIAESPIVPSAPSDFLDRLPSSIATAQLESGGKRPSPRVSIDESNSPTTAGIHKLRTDSHGRTLHPRSCVTCRRRKVKCDKMHPCTNCNRAKIECVFPSPGRAPRKTRKSGDGGRDKELLERLRRLEGMVKDMGVDGTVPPHESNGIDIHRPDQSKFHHDDSGLSASPTEIEVAHANGDTAHKLNDGEVHGTGWLGRSHSDKTRYIEEHQTGRFENRFGRLVIAEGKSRYINSSFWANLGNEVEDLKGFLNQTSDEEDEDAAPASAPQYTNAHQGWVFGFSSTNVDLLALHPLPKQVNLYWHTYKDRVDPLVKVLHIPTIEPFILHAAGRLATLSKSFEVLMFSIYYAATTSATPEECLSRFGEEKPVLLARYRFAVEQALARANFLNAEEMTIIQGFVIFMICLRRNSNARVIWTLTGLIVRLAQTIGIHRDGTHFGLSPFEIEMRRRLWWQICLLDVRASEDHGCDPTIIEQAFDTKIPLNINDVDISPETTDFPPERQGCTDITFCLIRFEVANTFRRLNYVPPGPPRACSEMTSNATLQDKEQWIRDCHQRLEEKYLKHCDMSVPLFWVTATIARLMMSKMWLMVYHPFQRENGAAGLSEETREKLFITSLENIEYSILLETEARTMKWGWLFKTYMQWHALACLLSELCKHTHGDLVDRAWAAIEKTRDGRWSTDASTNSPAGHLWRPLKKLYRKAKEARQRAMSEDALETQRAAMFGPVYHKYSLDPANRFQRQEFSQTATPPPDRAKLIRLDQSPSYGQVPQKHILGISDLQPLAASTQPTTASPLRRSFDQASLMNDNLLSSSPAMANSKLPNLSAQSPSDEIGDFGIDPTAATTTLPISSSSFTDSNQMSFFPNNTTGLDNLTPDESTDLDMSAIMDNSGNLDWQSWDQLVRQFGMDIDAAPAANSNGSLVQQTDWTGGGGNWDYASPGAFISPQNPANLRMTTGTSFGDLF